MKVQKCYGIVADHGEKVLKLCIVKNEGLALVSYKDGMSIGFKNFTREEAKILKRLLEEHLDYRTQSPLKESKLNKQEMSDTVRKLTTMSSSDPEYIECFRNAKPEEIDMAIKIMNGKKKAAKTVAKAETKGKRGRKAKESKPVEKKADVIQFPKPKPELEHKLVTEGNATYEECEAKINKEREMFKDSDSEYVFVGLLELAKVDADFRNNLMREDKSFTGAMEYMMKQVQAGYGYKKGQMGWCDKDLGLGFAIDYYNTDENAKSKSETTKVETEEEGEEE